MYMGELGAAGETQIITVDTEDQCRAARGVVIGFIRQGTAAHDQYGRLLPGNVRCAIPTAAPQTAPAPPITVTVSPQIQTQVSPQISPAFQQQFQPSGSPMSAGTSQTGTTQAAVPPGPVGVTGGSALPPAPAPTPAAPAYYPTPQASGGYGAPPPQAPEQLPAMALPASVDSTGMAPVSTPAPAPAPAPLFDWKMMAIIGAGVVGALALSQRRK